MLVPVIDSVNVPAVVELQETVAVPDPVTLVGVIAPQVNPAGTVSVRETTPAKPPTDVIVMVEEAELPALTAAGEEAEIVKSCGAVNVNVAVAEWLSDPLVPVTVRVNVPALVELQETVADPDPVTLVGVMAPQVNPDGTVSVRETVPAKPLSAVTVMVEVADVPALTDAGELAAMVKSTKLKVAVAECVSEPLVPVTVRVKVPAVVELHETEAVPEPARLVGVMAPHVSPDGTVSVNDTVPVKPLTAVTVIVDVADAPTLTAVGEIADTEKSVTVKVAVVE